MKCSLILLLSCLAVAGCGASNEPSSADGASSSKQPVMLLAAASTGDAVEELAKTFEQEQGVVVKVSTGPSSGLAQQILAGAPADVFISANEKWGAAVQEKGLAVKSAPLLTNRLVLVVPRGNPAGMMSPEDLMSDKVKRIALAGEQVPAGMYADQALKSAGVHAALDEAGKIVRGHDVRITLGYVEQGEVEAGVVYATDAKLTDRVEVVYTFPADAHDPIRYPALLLKRKDASPAAGEFYAYLFSREAERVFRKYGFALAEEMPGADGGSE